MKVRKLLASLFCTLCLLVTCFARGEPTIPGKFVLPDFNLSITRLQEPSGTPKAFSEYSLGGGYDFVNKQGSIGVLTYAFPLTNLFQKGWSLDTWAYAGVNTRTNSPQVGGVIGKSYQPADQVKISGGVFVVTQADLPIGVGLAGMITIKFNS